MGWGKVAGQIGDAHGLTSNFEQFHGFPKQRFPIKAIEGTPEISVYVVQVYTSFSQLEALRLIFIRGFESQLLDQR